MRVLRLVGVAAIALAVVAVVAVLALRGGGGVVHHGGAAIAARPPAAPAIGVPRGAGVRIGAHPIGLSIEYPLLAEDLGGGRCPPAAFVRVFTGLGSPALRIGGDSQDETAPAGTPPFPGVSDLPSRFWGQLRCLERETAIPVVVGLNLASGRPAWAARLAASARAAVPSARLSFELGNEPDIYGAPVKWWNGRALVSSAMPRTTYLSRAEAVRAVLGSAGAVEGPDFASGRWIAAAPMLARTLALSTIDAHFYPLDGCRPGAGAGATSAELLSRQIQAKLDERVRLARDARAAGLAAVISEAGSVSCGGLAGVSDTPAAAVWAVRMVLTALRDGFSSVRFHSSGGAYDPFVARHGAIELRPLYLGLRAVAGLLTPGALLRAIPGSGGLDAAAISRSDGSETIMASNYSAETKLVTVRASGRVAVLTIEAGRPVIRRASVAAAAGRARVELAADSVDAITLRGG